VPDGVFPGPEYLLNQGMTAYHGIVDIAAVGEGDVVLVSGAAGGVGSMAAQIAKARGAARVIGVAGGPEKCRYLVDELGLDSAIDHRNDDLDDRLTELAPTASRSSSTPPAAPSSKQHSGTQRSAPASRCAAPSPDRSAAATAGTPASTS
jgi:D-arabinose 1-dehydrogenase-like Zn-dependent alcohol dehydrogenase